VLFGHSDVSPLCFLSQSELLSPMLVQSLRLAASGGCHMTVLQSVARKGTRVRHNPAGECRGSNHPAACAMTRVVGLDGRMVLAMMLLRMATLLLVVVHHGHALLAARRAIETGVGPLLLVVTVHASRGVALGALRRGFG